MFWLQFVDAHDKEVTVPLTLTVVLETSLGKLGTRKESTEERDWTSKLPTQVMQGRSTSEPVYLRLKKGDSGPGVMDVAVTMSNETIHEAKIRFKSDLYGWTLLGCIVAGSLLWTAISFLLDRIKKRAFSSTEVLLSIGGALVIAIVAYFIDPSRVSSGLVDKSTLEGALQYGVIVSAIGLDGIIKKFTP